MTLSRTLAQFINKTKYEDLPQEVIDFTKLCILDWLGSALAGKDKEPIRMIQEFVEEMGGNQQATLVTGGMSSVINAALVNGASSHIVELDDIHKASIIHAGTVVIPAALSVAEANNKSGKELITAVVVGYDVCYRIGEAVSASHYYHWHNTATCGTFGAAAAVSSLLNLNEEQTVYALGSAGTQAAGLWEFIEDGAMSKQLHPAKAAVNGVISALLAKKGFTSASKILEGKRGFFKSMSDEFDESKITNQLGEIYKITENSFKIHASCRHTHPAVDMVIDIANENLIQIQLIDKIRVNTYQAVLNITDNPNPTTVYASKFSIQFCVALAIVKGKASLSDFNEETLWDIKIRDLMERIEVSVDPDIDGSYPNKWGASVDIVLSNGSVLSKQTEFPKGDPENAVTVEELILKFKQLTGNDSNTEMYSEQVMNLENINDIGKFFVGQKEEDLWKRSN